MWYVNDNLLNPAVIEVSPISEVPPPYRALSEIGKAVDVLEAPLISPKNVQDFEILG